MSRRKRPDDSVVYVDDQGNEVPPKDDGTKSVRVICTGRRRHNPVSFGSVLVVPQGGVIEELIIDEWHAFADGGLWNVEEDGRSRATYPFLCRRCRPARNVPISRQRLEHLVSAVADAGGDTLDLSALHEAS